MTTIRTDNYSKIFEYINSLKPCATSVELRKYKSMFARLVRECSKGEETIKTIGAEKIEDLTTQKIVVAFGAKETMDRVGTSKDELIKRCLFDEVENSDIYTTKWFEQSSISKTEYMPVFYLSKKSSIPLEKTATKFRNNYCQKIEDIERISKVKGQNISTISELKQYCDEQTKLNNNKIPTKALFEIARQAAIGNIARKDIKHFLCELYIVNSKVAKESDFKKALCFADK